MKIRWIHTADVHLGYQQYGSPQRADDFARAFKHVCDHAIRDRVDFVLIAGDLFHKRAVDPRTMDQAFTLLAALKGAGIPALCVEGNHERALYNNQSWTWLTFLAMNDLLYLLEPDDSAGHSTLALWDPQERKGGYVDIGPARIYGIKYYGASAPRVLQRVSDQLSAESERPFGIVMLHEGMEGQIPRSTGGLSGTQLEVLRPHCEYLALGHIHKRYDFGAWAYNPGSLETVSSEETQWDRGYYVVEADAESRTLLDVQHYVNPRRPFHRVFVHVEACATPESLEQAMLRQVERELMDGSAMPPVLDVTLVGTLQFADDALKLDRLEALVREGWDPLIVRVKNSTVRVGQSFEGALGPDGQIDRRALELQVFQQLLAGDARYERQAVAWAHTVQAVKDSVLQKQPPEEIVTLLERGIERTGGIS